MRITGPNGLTQRSCSAKGEYPSVLCLRERERERETERQRQRVSRYTIQGSMFLFIACKLAMNQTL